MELGIEKWVILVMKSGKRPIADAMELPNQDIIRTLREKENYKYLGDIGSWHLQTRGDERKIKKEYFRKKQKVTQDKTI